VGRPTTAADAAAPAVEQGDGHVVAMTGGDNVVLRVVEIPSRRHAADVLRRIGIADHHFLPAADTRAIPRDAEQRVDHRPGVTEIARRLEQRHDPQRRRHLRFLLQQFDRQHVRRVARHRDHVRSERSHGSPRNHPERVEHLASITTGVEVGRDQRTTTGELALEKAHARGFVPLGIRPETQRGGNLGERFRMS
jgi:hypothetical protein